MTYESSEISQHSGKPVELFRYEGTYQNFYYTSNNVEVEFQAPGDPAPVTYAPIPMKRSQVNVGTQNDDNAEITIDMPVTVDLVAIYGFQISPPDLFLTVYRQHNPGEFVRYWGGPVDNINVLRGTASIRVPSRLAQALSADFPNVYYQGPCNHSLGDTRCGVDMVTHETATTISALAGKAITVASVGTLNGKLVGGEALLPSGERRMIISQAGLVVNVNYPFAGAEVADTIILSEGCDLAFDGDCGTKFANQERFGGFPFIPPKNIFSTGLQPGKDVSDTSCLPIFYALNIHANDFNSSNANNGLLITTTLDQYLTIIKPRVIESNGLLLWDAWSAWPTDGATIPPPPIIGQTWTNDFKVWGSNGGAETLVWQPYDHGLDPFLYPNEESAFLAISSILPINLTGYTNWRISCVIDLSLGDNRNGLSLLAKVTN